MTTQRDDVAEAAIQVREYQGNDAVALEYWARMLAAEVQRLRAVEIDHCGDPMPSLFGHPTASWCIRRPGHAVPHRDSDGATWIRHVEPRTDAGCPVGECGHPASSHEPDEYAADGTPVRPICCAGDCRCGQQWRNA